MIHDPIAAAISFALSSYADSELIDEKPTIVSVEVSATPKKRGRPRKETSSASGEVKAPITAHIPGPKRDPLPAPGTIGAKEFLERLPHCGKRPNNRGVPVFSGVAAQREDEMRLVAAYIGWDSSQLHGWNLDNARRTARLAMRPVAPGSHRRGFGPIAGFVAGLPDAVKTKVKDLLAREELASDSIAENKRKLESAPNAQTKALFQGLISLEEERIKQIRKDLASFGVDSE